MGELEFGIEAIKWRENTRGIAQLEGWRRYRHLVHVLILVYVPAHHNPRNLPTTHSGICSQCNHSLQLLVWVLTRTRHGVIKLISTFRIPSRPPLMSPASRMSTKRPTVLRITRIPANLLPFGQHCQTRPTTLSTQRRLPAMPRESARIRPRARLHQSAAIWDPMPMISGCCINSFVGPLVADPGSSANYCKMLSWYIQKCIFSRALVFSLRLSSPGSRFATEAPSIGPFAPIPRHSCSICGEVWVPGWYS